MVTSAHPKITLEPFRSDKVLAVVSAKSPLAQKPKLKEGDLAKLPLIARIGGRITKQLQENGYKNKLVIHCDSVGAVKAAVKAGMGLGCCITI